MFGKNEKYGYFDQLPKLTQLMIKRLVTEAFENEVSADVYNTRVEDIECRSRDGFIPYSHNKGGVDVNGYTDLSIIMGSGYYPKNPKSCKRIEAIVDSALQDATKAFWEKHETELKAAGFDSLDKVSYHALYEAKLGKLAEELSEYENAHTSGEYATVLYQYRLMYHGKDAKGVHSMTVFASINTEAPYHRGKYDDNVSEIEITWRKGSALKPKLIKALREAAKQVF